MPRYIDADKIPYFHYLGDDTAMEGVDYTLKGVIESRVPTEDVAPVVHGYWRPIYPDKIFEHQNRAKYYKCSVCGRTSADENYSNGLDFNFCPYCSAKMDMDGEPHDP